MIAYPADCVVLSVIRFFKAKNVKTFEIHLQLAEICGENVMHNAMVRKWIRQFIDGIINVNDEAWSEGPPVVHGGLHEKVNKKKQMVHNKIAL
ncbi:HTH_48 domain-containing protein [Trichonephila clavipes]|nr:HTH_48 domain-containing protein [Trichonephila clavipes]